MNNPLKQYFRRPALYIKLPSNGDFYPPGSLEMPENRELPVFPMTAIDEITSKTPDALYNGVAIPEIIKSCIPAIKEPWHIPSCDLDTILIGIRVATNGNDLEIETVCPKCEETSKYGINLIGLLNNISSDSYKEVLNIGVLKVKFKPLPYKILNSRNVEQFEIERQINGLLTLENEEERNKQTNTLLKKLADLNISTMAQSIESITTPEETVYDFNFIDEFLRSCDKKTHDDIRKHIVSAREKTEIKPIKIKCIHCSNDYEQKIQLNISDFFD